MKKEKTMGEILKEEGLIEEEPQEEVPEKKEERGVNPVEELTIRVEKLEGKLEMEKEARVSLEERLSTMSESIGDLRRMILDREKDISRMEKDVEEMKEMLKYLEPSKIEKRFEKFTMDIEKVQANIEKFDVLTKELRERLKRVEDKISKLGSFEGLADVMEKIRKIEADIKEEKRNVDVAVGKVESIFSDMSENLASIRKERETIEKLNDIVTDLLKTVDKLNMKMENDVVQKKDFESIKEQFEYEMKQNLETAVQRAMLSQKGLNEIIEEKKKLENALDTAENDYKLGKISAESYEELRRGIETKLNVINDILDRINKEALAKTVEENTERLNRLERIISEIPKGEEFRGMKKMIEDINGRLNKLPIDKILSLQLKLESNKLDKDEFERFKKWIETMMERNIVLLKKIAGEI